VRCEIQKAILNDTQDIKNLINEYASKDLMLSKTEAQIFDDIWSFYVARENNENALTDNDNLMGCCSLGINSEWGSLGEIKSLAVKEIVQKQGVGKKMVESCIEEARNIGLKKVFTLTYQNNFFEKIGFVEIKKDELPQAVWAECVNCHKFPDCNEIAMAMDL
jgi:amino-acid N-acetyltransferase